MRLKGLAVVYDLGPSGNEVVYKILGSMESLISIAIHSLL